MNSEIDIIKRFDRELKSLSRKYKRRSVQQFLITTALQRREALKAFIQTHERLPHSMRELVTAKIATPSCYRFEEIESLPDRGKSLTVSEYLAITRTADDHRVVFTPGIHIASILTLYLLRAVYAAADRSQVAQSAYSKKWAAAAAQILRKNGFSESQLELIRTDAGVRMALARLAGVAPKSP